MGDYQIKLEAATSAILRLWHAPHFFEVTFVKWLLFWGNDMGACVYVYIYTNIIHLIHRYDIHNMHHGSRAVFAWL